MKYKREDVVLFYSGPFSQWYPSFFIIDDIMYNTAEQYMMAEKARLFKDKKALKAILETNSPSEQKTLGRMIKNFDKDAWESIARGVVFRGNYAKFTQDKILSYFLLSTGDKIIVEASPFDRIWGIGLSEHDKDCLDTDKWKGTNWLGEAIMKVRDEIRMAS